MAVASEEIAATLNEVALTTAKASDLSRRKATMAILAESASETVAYDTYANCASTGSYSLAAVTKPAGFNVVVSSVQYWNKSSSPVGWVNTCTVDPGAQQITITASSTGASYTTVLVVAKEAP